MKKKVTKIVSIAALALLLASCNNTSNSQSKTSHNSEAPISNRTSTTDQKDSKKTNSAKPSSDKESEKTNSGSSSTTKSDSTDPIVYYTVTFDLDGGTIADPTAVKTQKVQEGRWAKKPIISPTKDHCEFLGWYDSEFLYNFNQPVYGNLNLKAKWSVNEEEKVTLTIDPNNGQSTYTVDTFLGDYVSLDTPSKEGMVFTGWYLNDDESQKFTGRVTEEARDSSRIVAHYEKQSFNYKFIVNDDGTVTITGIYDIDSVVLNIPSTINGRNVTAIGENAFNSRISITDIDIPSTVTSISPKAFVGARALKSITVNSNNTAFESDGGVLYTKGKTEIVFCPPKYTTSAFTLPDTVVKVGDYAFYGHSDSGISSINFNEGLEEIGAYAFYENEKITSLTFPSTLKKIGGHAFYSNGQGTNQLNLSWNEGLEEIGEDAFLGQYIKGTLSFPSTVKVIGDYSFCTPADSHCAITKVELPASLETFGNGAFFYGVGIESISIPDSNKNFKVVDDVLYSKDGTKLVWCPSDMAVHQNISEFDIPSGVIELLPHSMSDIRYVDGINFPSTLKKIDDNAFHNNYYLTSLVIPDSVTEIGEEAFMMMDKLTSVTFGKGVKNIPEAAFYECSSMTDVEIPAFIDTVEKDAFFGCNLKSVTFHEGLKSIGDTAFAAYTTGSGKITSLVFPDSLQSIGASAFAGQSNIKTITFGKNINNIGGNAFGEYGGNAAPVPSELLATPDAIQAGLKVANDTLISADGKKAMYCVAGYTGAIVLPEGVEEVSPYAFKRVKATSVKLPSTLKTIGEGAFEYAFVYKKGETEVKLDIPASVSTIGEGAFYFSNVASLTLHQGLEEIGTSAFEMAMDLTGSVEFPASVKKIGDDAFANSSLLGITFNEGLEEIGKEAFLGNNQLSGVLALPSTLKSIGEAAFVGRRNSYSNSLTDITLPNGSNYFAVENTALYNKDKTRLVYVPARTTQTSITFASTLKTIDSYAISGNQNLTDVVLPDGLETISEGAFAYCPFMSTKTSLVIPSSITAIGYRAFDGWKSTQKIAMPWSEDKTLMNIGDDWKNSCRATITYKD